MKPPIRSVSPAARLVLASGLAAFAAAPASATWSILIADTRTGEIAVGSATCVVGIDLRAETPVLLLGRGAVTAQSAVDTSGANRARIYEQLARGVDLDDILALQAAVDAGHGNRQYGMITADGQTLTYSGVQNAAWAGGVTGRIEAGAPGPADDIVYAVQGNILTGEPVVLAAEDAIINTPGDLAEKLMAAMEAAYDFGGDGRCSCDNADPTGCGAPPDTFVNTADVGYMLVGRLGDREMGASFVTLDATAGETLIGDADGDGKADLFTTPSFGGPVEFRRNVSASPGDPLIFESVAVTGNLSQTRGGELIDVNQDGLADLVVTTSSRGYIAMNQGGGAFAPAVDSAIASGIRGGVSGEFDGSNAGPEWAAINSGSLRTYALDGATAFTQVASQPLGATGQVIARTPGGVAVGLSSAAILPFDAVGDGTFALGPALSIQAAPITLHAADLNGDGQTDYVAGRGDQRVSVVVSVPGDDATIESEINPGGAVRDTEMADFDGDGDLDFAVLITFGRMRVYLNDGAGNFSAGPQVRLLDGTLFSGGDVTGDGLPELVIASSRVLGVFLNEGAGPADNERGFAGGDYFLELNVPNSPTAPFLDPVPQLRSEFDAWRAMRVGVPDGVQSVIVDAPTRVNVQGSQAGPYQIVVDVRDFAGNPAGPLDPARFDIAAPAGSPVPLVVTSAMPGAGAGEWILTAEPTGETGRSELWVRYNADAGPAVVQPAPAITAGLTLADLNADGRLDLADVVDFVTAFSAGDFAADLDGSGLLDLADVTLFVTEFNAG